MSILNINNLSVEYIGDKSSTEALKNVSIDVDKNQIVGLYTTQDILNIENFPNASKEIFSSFALCLTSNNESKDYLIKLNVKNVFCTKIASKLTRTYSSKHGLKDLVYEILDIQLDKTEQSSETFSNAIPIETASSAFILLPVIINSMAR